jgi:DNA-binding MarR family transcriptional regulator
MPGTRRARHTSVDCTGARDARIGLPGKFGQAVRVAVKNNKATSVEAERHARMLEVLKQFRIVFKSVRQHYQEVQKKSGVSGAQLWALAQVAKAPGGTVGGLGGVVPLHHYTASNLVNRLVELALIVRRREGADQRIVHLHLTAKGTRVLSGAPKPLIGVLQQALGQMSERNLVELHRQLEALVRSLPVKGSSAAKSLPLSEM